MGKMRKEFEDWFEADSMPLESDWFTKDDDGDYDHMPTYYAWKAWQASRAALCVELPMVYSDQFNEDSYYAPAVRNALDKSGVPHK